MALNQSGDAESKSAGDGAEQLREATKIVEPGTTAGGGAKGGKSGGGGGGSGKSGGGGSSKEERKSIVGQWAALLQFLREVVIEFKKISWPERGQVIRETWSVLFLVAIITVMVLVFDFGLSHLFFTPVENWARMHGGGFGGGFGR